MATKTKSAPLDPKVADKLLDLLSTDNEFRRLFKKNPEEALIQAGYRGPPFTPPGPPFTPPGPPSLTPPFVCMQVQRIAPKADIVKARVELKAMLTSSLAQNPPQLDAAITAARRTRK